MSYKKCENSIVKSVVNFYYIMYRARTPTKGQQNGKYTNIRTTNDSRNGY